MKSKVRGFYKVHHDMLRDQDVIKDIGADAWAVYNVITSHIDHRSGLSYPSYSKIERCTGLSRGTVSKSLKRLEESGLIKKIKKGNAGGRNNTYEVRDYYNPPTPTNTNKAPSNPPTGAIAAQPTPIAPLDPLTDEVKDALDSFYPQEGLTTRFAQNCTLSKI